MLKQHKEFFHAKEITIFIITYLPIENKHIQLLLLLLLL